MAEDERGPRVGLEVGHRRDSIRSRVAIVAGRIAVGRAAVASRRTSADARDGEGPDPPAPQVVERGMADDPVEPARSGRFWSYWCQRSNARAKHVVRRVHCRIRVAQDRVGDAVDVVGVIPVGPLDGLASGVSRSSMAHYAPSGPDPCIVAGG